MLLRAKVISPQTSSRRECHLAANVMDIRSFAAVKKSSGAFAPQQSDRSAAARSRWHSHSWLCTLPSPIVGFAVGTDKQNPPPIAASLTACRHASPVRLHPSVVIPSPLAFATKSQVRGAWCLTKSRGLRPNFLRRARNPSCVLHLARFVAQGAPLLSRPWGFWVRRSPPTVLSSLAARRSPNSRRNSRRWGEPALGTRKDSPRAVPSLLPQAVPEAALP